MTNDSNVSSIRAGRRADRFVTTPEWILVAGLSAQAQALYTALLAHVNRKAGDGIAWPGMAVLATMLGYRKRQSISPYLDELSALGAIQVVKVKCPSGQRNEYVVHEIPPVDYLGFRNLADFYRDRRERAAEERMSARADIARSVAADVAASATADMNQSDGTTGTDPWESASSSGHTPVGHTSPSVRLGHRSAPTARKIVVPPYFYDETKWPDKRFWPYLVGAAVKALEADGMVMPKNARDAVGYSIKHQCGDRSRRDVVKHVREWVRRAGTTGDKLEWLAYPEAS